MSKVHGLVLIVAVLGIVGGPATLALALESGYFLRFWAVSIPAGIVTVGYLWANCDFYVLPFTYRLRALNRKNGAEREQIALLWKARDCRQLAKTYRSRNEPYQAEILEAEADHKERQAAMREEDAQRIQRELEDRKMQELTK